MEIEVDSKGRRVRNNRPYIDQEETMRNVIFYDPNGPGYNAGLYDTWKPNDWNDRDRACGIQCDSGQCTIPRFTQNFMEYVETRNIRENNFNRK